jgi:hypothetical protein
VDFRRSDGRVAARKNLMDHQQTFHDATAAVLKGWVDESRQEDLHLDFKLLAQEDIGRDDRRNFAKALSAFANSDGGLIVWGIDCRKGPTGADVASSLLPIGNVRAVLSRLTSLTGDATSPVVPGVQHRIVYETTDTGYVLTWVPPSERGPHMAMLGEGRYFKRSGDRFYQLEHFDLEDMFGRRARPDLQVVVTPMSDGASSGMHGRSADLKAVVSLLNRGRGVAKFPFVRIQPGPPYRVSSTS